MKNEEFRRILRRKISISTLAHVQFPCYNHKGGLILLGENVLYEKSLKFSVRIVELRKYLNSEKREYDLASQILNSGTSIGANVNEANYAQSKADFTSKLHIALKEASETLYWLHVLKATDYLTPKVADSLISDCEELKKLLISSINTAKKHSC